MFSALALCAAQNTLGAQAIWTSAAVKHRCAAVTMGDGDPLRLPRGTGASELGIELTVEPDTWLSEAPMNMQALVSIIGNLVDNAFEVLSTVNPPGRVAVSIVEEAHALTIWVADNGPGIPAGDHRLIFTDGYTTKQGHRRGLGLAIVHRLVTRLDGTISVSEGAGARFTVHLSVARSRDLRGIRS